MAVSDRSRLEAEIQYLIDRGLVQVYKQEESEEPIYRLAHERLVPDIVKYLNSDQEQHDRRLAEDGWQVEL